MGAFDRKHYAKRAVSGRVPFCTTFPGNVVQKHSVNTVLLTGSDGLSANDFEIFIYRGFLQNVPRKRSAKAQKKSFRRLKKTVLDVSS